MTTDLVTRVTGRLVAVLVAAGVAAATTSVWPAVADSAAPAVQRCSDLGGQVEHRKIVGDLVVDVPCTLVLASVAGDVRFDGSAGRLWTERSTIKGDVHATGSVTLYLSTVQGGVQLDAPGGAFNATDSTVRHSVRGRVQYAYFTGARLDGAFNTTTYGGGAYFEDATVGGWVNSHGGFQVVRGSSLARGMTATATNGGTICGSSIASDVTFTRNTFEVAVGLTPTSWPLEQCESSGFARSTIGGTVTLTDNPELVRVGYVDIAGDLVCTGNSGPGGVAVDDDVTIGGSRLGQCT